MLLALFAVRFSWGLREELKQTASCGGLKHLRNRLEEFQQARGSFPEKVTELGEERESLADAWGHPYVYHRIGSGYLLASLGRDGVGPPLDWQRLHRLVAKEEKLRVGRYRWRDCRHLEIEMIATDAGFYRCCGK